MRSIPRVQITCVLINSDASEATMTEFLLWGGFFTFIAGMLVIDLGLFNSERRQTSIAAAALWTLFCVLLALGFNGVVFYLYSDPARFGGLPFGALPLSGRDAALQFFTGWLVEQSLSLDNLFVIAVIFQHFGIPPQYQRRVLFWGILGAVITRGAFIGIGAALIKMFWWIEYVFGLTLLYAAYKMLRVGSESVSSESNVFVKLARRFYPVTNSLYGERFFIVEADGVRAMTPLFVALLVIESTDVLFAVDSIPAVFAITSDPFLVFTSNIFAVLCLRSMYFVLLGLLNTFHYLKLGLTLMLAFIALKMLTSHFIEISAETSLMIVIGCLIGGIGASMFLPHGSDKEKI